MAELIVTRSTGWSGGEPAVVMITGIQAAGKSTVAQALAERLPRSVHVRGDLFRRMVVGGRAELTPDPSDEAVRQLHLRYRLAADVVDGYVAAGFTAIVQDIVLGDDLARMLRLIRSRPLLVVVLAPSPEAVAAREAGRGKTGYGIWGISQLDDELRKATPRIGLWLDTSDQTVEETVAEIMTRGWSEGRVP
ncbi:AAA family ATPase [Micromonospora sp. CPCC 206060]|uniref:AAA family ATPase n=1 Tax=Micromonospora sp. CPCC 206060 TaxID=3122406 RepID=UPI002FF07CA4